MKKLFFTAAALAALTLLLASCAANVADVPANATVESTASASASSTVSASKTTPASTSTSSASASASDSAPETVPESDAPETDAPAGEIFSYTDDAYFDNVLEDDVSLMSVSISVPKLSDGAAADTINAALSEISAAAVAEADDISSWIDSSVLAGGQPYFVNLSYEIACNDGNYFSVLLTSSEYTGGTHPNSARFGRTFDPLTGKALTLDDVVGADGVKKAFALVKDSLASEQAADPDSFGFFDDFAETIDNKVKNGEYADNWYVSDGGKLHIIFGAYEIGPYSAGTYEQTIELSELAKG